MTEFTVVFYKTKAGRSPINDFVMSLQPSAQSKTLRMLELLRSKGSMLGMPYSRSMGKNLFELRVHDKQEIRLFYVFNTGKRIYVLHAFQKKSQQTPAKELAIARSRQSELTEI